MSQSIFFLILLLSSLSPSSSSLPYFDPIMTPSSPCLLPGATPSPLLPSLPYVSPGYYAPNLNVTNPTTYPSTCPPTFDCQKNRLFAKECDPQCLYEPLVVPQGYYSPDSLILIECPQEFYCPLGSTSPIVCESLTLCPVGSCTQKFYGGLIITLIVDIAIYIGFKYYTRHINQLQGVLDENEKKKAQAQGAGGASSKKILGHTNSENNTASSNDSSKEK